MRFSAQVLLVEDEILIADFLEETLWDAGYRVLTCLNGDQAIAALELDVSQFQILVTDIRMPGPDGWAVADRARELASGMPVVYVTGDSFGQWASRGVSNSILIKKPYRSAEVIDAVALLLKRVS